MTLVDPAEDGYKVVRVFNLHGMYYHTPEDQEVTHRPGCREDTEGKGLPDYKGQSEDALKSRLAKFLTEAAAEVGLKLRFEYR